MRLWAFIGWFKATRGRTLHMNGHILQQPKTRVINALVERILLVDSSTILDIAPLSRVWHQAMLISPDVKMLFVDERCGCCESYRLHKTTFWSRVAKNNHLSHMRFLKWRNLIILRTHFFPGSKSPTEGKIVQEMKSLGVAETFHMTPPDVRTLVIVDEVESKDGVKVEDAVKVEAGPSPASASRAKTISPSSRLG